MANQAILTGMDEHGTSQRDRTLQAAPPKLYALVAEYDNVDAVMAAAEKVRDAGFTKWDVHAPFPIHGIDPAMGTRPTILPWIVLLMGITGGTTGILLTHYTMGVTPEWHWLPESLKGYQFPISGKPMWSTPAFIPVIFELTIMFSAYTAVFAMWMMNLLPKLYNPLFKLEKFRRATDDRFFVVVQARDGKFDERSTGELLRSTHPLSVEAVTE